MVAALRPQPAADIAWCLVYNRAAGRDEVLVRYGACTAQLAYWLSYDDVEQLHSVRFVRWPTDMDAEARDMLRADVLAYHQRESTEWQLATRVQVEGGAK